jgi:hypothetical protein
MPYVTYTLPTFVGMVQRGHSVYCSLTTQFAADRRSNRDLEET